MAIFGGRYCSLRLRLAATDTAVINTNKAMKAAKTKHTIAASGLIFSCSNIVVLLTAEAGIYDFGKDAPKFAFPTAR
jgi:hypothetical protein